MVHGWGICPTKKCGVGPAEQVGTYQTEELDLILLDDLIPRLTQAMDGREGRMEMVLVHHGLMGLQQDFVLHHIYGGRRDEHDSSRGGGKVKTICNYLMIPVRRILVSVRLKYSQCDSDYRIVVGFVWGRGGGGGWKTNEMSGYG